MAALTIVGSACGSASNVSPPSLAAGSGAASGKPAASGSASSATKPAGAVPSASPSGSGGASAAAKSGLQTVKIEVPNKGVAFTHLYVAEDLGLFEKHGLDAQISVVAPPAAVAAMQAGELDFMSAVGSGMSAALNNVPIRVVEVSSNHPSFLLFGAKGLTSVEQLKGKVVAAYAAGNTVNAVMIELLKRKGLDSGSYGIVNAGADAGRAAALENGAASATLMDASAGLPLRRDGFPVLASVDDMPDLPFTGLVTTQAAIKGKTAAVRETIAAVLEGTDLVGTQKDKVAPVMQKEFDLSPADAGQIFDLLRGGWTSAGKPSQAATDFELANLKNDLKLEALPTVDQVYDFSVLDSLSASASPKS
jgi:NitT/TauT family transport system substrate-binding protein